MKVLDLFCGLKGWSEPFARRGHEVLTLDIDPVFKPTFAVDFLNWGFGNMPWKPDVILASPPCEAFSTMSMGKHWTHEGEPKTMTARLGRDLVLRTKLAIQILKPKFAIIENPRARLRSLPFLEDYERRTVWYCHLGEKRAKPTDLWGKFPKSLRLPAECHNNRNHPPDCCCADHVTAPRGSRTGTQGGLSRVESAKIPRQLAGRVCRAMERDLGERK